MLLCLVFFFFNDTATTEIYTLSLHDALPIFLGELPRDRRLGDDLAVGDRASGGQVTHHAARRHALLGRHLRSEEHTSELQSPCNLVCRLLLEKKKNKSKQSSTTSVVN